MATTVHSTQDNGIFSMAKLNEYTGKATDLIKSSRLQSLKKIPNFNKKIVIAVIVVILVAIGAFLLFRAGGGQDTQSLDQTYVADGSRVELNKSFNVPIRSNKGDLAGSDLVVNVTTLERTDKILYKGKPLVARSGKDFLVINLEVENSTNNRLTVRPVDFFRLVDANGKTYAPDIQTDPVKVEPLSSKKTRTMYIISENQKTIKLTIGEIKGENKETVEVSI